MLIRNLAVAAASAVALGAGLLATSAANAAPLPSTHVITSNGEAGYQASMNGPGHFTSVRTTWYVRKAEETIGSSTQHGIGVQLCNDASAKAVQVGLIHTGGNQFTIGYGSGTLTATSPGTNTTACNSGGQLTPTALTPAITVSQGDYVKVGLFEISPGWYEAYAKDLTTGVAISKGFAGLSFPDEAGVGAVADQTTRSAPSSATELANFNSINLADAGTGGPNASGGLNGSGDWAPPQSAGSNSIGTNGSPLLVAPAPLSNSAGTAFKLYAGAPTGP